MLGSPEPPTIKADANISADADAVWRSFLTVKPDGRYARWYLPVKPMAKCGCVIWSRMHLIPERILR
ncbi:MAG: hypothetical protein LRY40_08260 [Shewanella fodinae]|nr:hypothetical protein [Shewanella fodinae]